MAQPKIRGVRSEHELNSESLYRDTRHGVTKFFHSLRTPAVTAGVVCSLAFVSLVAPGVSELCLMLGLFFFAFGMTRGEWAAVRGAPFGGGGRVALLAAEPLLLLLLLPPSRAGTAPSRPTRPSRRTAGRTTTPARLRTPASSTSRPTLESTMTSRRRSRPLS